MSNLYGSLCLSASTPQVEFPQFKNAQVGHHTPHQFELITQSGVAADINKQLGIKLPLMESRFEDARQLYKFNRIQTEIWNSPELVNCSGFVSLIINTGEHGHIGVLSQGQDVFVHGIYDTVNMGVRLVWTTDDWFIQDVRASDFTRYVFYRFPVLRNRPLFLYSQALCSKWYGWARQFKEPDGVLKAFNALENFLYKEPELPSLGA